MEYKIQVSGNAPYLYPTDVMFGLLWYDEDSALEIPLKYPFGGEWGMALTTICALREDYPIPYKLNILWLSIVEEKFYELECNLPVLTIENLFNQLDSKKEILFSHILVGMSPYGKIAVWVYGFNKSVLILWEQGDEVSVDFQMFRPFINPLDNVKDYCRNFIDNDSLVDNNLKTAGLPPYNLFDNYMQQFTYRYIPQFEKWNEEEDVKWEKYKEEEDNRPEFEYIEESLFDGTFDKLHDDGLLKYHKAGKPKKLAIKWHIEKSEYTAYFWFEDEKICSVFERFYGAHPDTKTDFIIRIDAEKKKYELALFRQGLKEPQIIPEDAYQLLVFKNKFENYRSDNYNQERGAWIW